MEVELLSEHPGHVIERLSALLASSAAVKRARTNLREPWRARVSGLTCIGLSQPESGTLPTLGEESGLC